MSPFVISNFLASHDRTELLAQLSSPELQWKLASQLGRSATGLAYQLADGEQHGRDPMVRVGRFVASAVYDELIRCAVLAAGAAVLPQVFPVLMYGDPRQPPAQETHVDSAIVSGERRHPLITTVYYPLVHEAEGGLLVALDGDEERLSEIALSPATNDLIVMTGTQRHRVTPLVRGYRVSVIANFYSEESDAGIGGSDPS
ncbi:MAG: 2OG-Fe(II) oxygenase [Acidobacteriota bacterium]